MGFNIIKNDVVYEETEKRSKFISYSFKVSSSSEAKEKLGKVKALHHSAKHHVYAYSIFPSEEKCSDDGEPSGTGGIPILNAIKSLNLKNVMVVVVRYFGGILLGTGGLRRMYSSGACGVLEKSGIIKMQLCSDILVNCSYKQIGQISNVVSEFKGKILDIDYLGSVSIKFYIKKDLTDLIINKLENITCSKDKFKILSESYHEII